tara:strand:+ start:7157 stop:7327 length:171 start_codon:yes stop_codon:yes gene_type:complete
MAESKKKVKKKETKKVEVSKDIKYKITTNTGAVIYRDNLGDYVKVYEAKGYTVEEI